MSIMKKKKQYRDDFIGMQVLQGLIFHHHHHQHHHRRRRIHHLLPLLSAVSGCLLLLFAAVLFLSPPISDHRRHRHLTLNTSLNSRVEVHMNVEKENDFRVPKSGGEIDRDLWTSNQSNFFYGCSNASKSFLAAEKTTNPNRYLLIATSGGLNQQRTGIVDAVVAAYILNATLVIPKLDQKSFWKDASNFSQIFNVDWFMTFASKEIKVVKEVPQKIGRIVTTRAPRKCNRECYQTRILPIYERKRVRAVQLTKFDYRLSNRLASDLQKMRCRINYHGLRFTDPILDMGMKLVQRMRMKTNHYIALHLRFESDMLAFSGCDYGGGDKERKELGAIRKRWKTLHTKNPEKARRRGRCPLTPEEVGLMLRALGFGNDVHIYVASGDVYGGDETLAPLKALFPNFHTKETIASKEELQEFSSFSSRMAALDFIACDESDVFVTNNNGNMAKILAGKRRYFGHKPTIRPNAKKLNNLFMERDNMTWDEFATEVRKVQVGFMGEPNEVKPGRGEFHEHPLSCICAKPGANLTRYSTFQSNNRSETIGGFNGEANDEGLSEDELDPFETEYSEDKKDSFEEVVSDFR